MAINDNSIRQETPMNSNPEKPNESQTDPSPFETPPSSSQQQDFASRTPNVPPQPYVARDPRRKSPIFVIASIITVLASRVPPYMEPLLGLFLAFYWLYNLVDAGRRAAFYNQALAGMTDAPIPAELFKPLTEKGSMVGGTVLVLLGIFFLSHTRFGMSLRWLEEWWPMALIIAGAFLLIQSWHSRKDKL
jgi:hypothetical protein